jgi:hypothetical protein
MYFLVNGLLTRNLLAIFGERDAAARMMELETIWLPEGIFIDPATSAKADEALFILAN